MYLFLLSLQHTTDWSSTHGLVRFWVSSSFKKKKKMVLFFSFCMHVRMGESTATEKLVKLCQGSAGLRLRLPLSSKLASSWKWKRPQWHANSSLQNIHHYLVFIVVVFVEDHVKPLMHSRSSRFQCTDNFFRYTEHSRLNTRGHGQERCR